VTSGPDLFDVFFHFACGVAALVLAFNDRNYLAAGFIGVVNIAIGVILWRANRRIAARRDIGQ